MINLKFDLSNPAGYPPRSEIRGKRKKLKGANHPGRFVRITFGVVDNAPDSSQIVNLKGPGTVVKVIPTSMRFACGPIGCGPLTQTATVTNIGSTPVTITSIAITGTFSQPFSQTDTCPTSLGAGQSCTITVTVNSRPTNGSVSSGQVLISDNGGASPQTIFLVFLEH